MFASRYHWFNPPSASFSMPPIVIANFSTKAMLSIFSTTIDQHCGRSSQKASYCVENETSYYFKVYISCRGDFRLPQKNGRFNISLHFDACVPTNSMTFKIYRGKISRMGNPVRTTSVANWRKSKSCRLVHIKYESLHEFQEIWGIFKCSWQHWWLLQRFFRIYLCSSLPVRCKITRSNYEN